MAGEGGRLYHATHTLFGNMNYVPNQFRKLEFPEIEANHVWQATRHFPRIACSHGHRCSVCKTCMPRGDGGKKNMAETIQLSQPAPEERFHKIMSNERERPKTVSSLRRLKDIQQSKVTVENKLRGKLNELWGVKREYAEENLDIHLNKLLSAPIQQARTRIATTNRAKAAGMTFQVRTKTGS